MGNIRLIKWLPCSFTSQISSVSHITQIIRLIDTIGLIGYFRFALAIAAYYFINDPNRFLPLYVISCLLDAVDGHAARFLNQCTQNILCAKPSHFQTIQVVVSELSWIWLPIEVPLPGSFAIWLTFTRNSCFFGRS